MEAPVPASLPGTPTFTRNAENPSLARMVVESARRLSRAGRGFFLMAEQGDIDWANHANDLPRMLGATASLDEAVRAAVAWVDEPGDDVDWSNTLLVVTADHATGLPRFDPALSYPKGEVPARTGSTTYGNPGGAIVTYSTAGHGNELVTLAAKGAAAAQAFLPWLAEGRPGTRILDNTAIYRALRAFAGL
jgi:alkaline phosphatase